MNNDTVTRTIILDGAPKLTAMSTMMYIWSVHHYFLKRLKNTACFFTHRSFQFLFPLNRRQRPAYKIFEINMLKKTFIIFTINSTKPFFQNINNPRLLTLLLLRWSSARSTWNRLRAAHLRGRCLPGGWECFGPAQQCVDDVALDRGAAELAEVSGRNRSPSCTDPSCSRRWILTHCPTPASRIQCLLTLQVISYH